MLLLGEDASACDARCGMVGGSWPWRDVGKLVCSHLYYFPLRSDLPATSEDSVVSRLRKRENRDR